MKTNNIKVSLTRIAIILCFLPFSACETLSNPKSVTSVLATQAFSIGLSQITGRNVSAADVDGAAALIRSLAGKTAPAPAEIKTAVVTGTASPAAASTLGSKLSSLVTWAMSKGLPHDTALEITAKQLNAAADTKRP